MDLCPRQQSNIFFQLDSFILTIIKVLNLFKKVCRVCIVPTKSILLFTHNSNMNQDMLKVWNERFTAEILLRPTLEACTWCSLIAFRANFPIFGQNLAKHFKLISNLALQVLFCPILSSFIFFCQLSSHSKILSWTKLISIEMLPSKVRKSCNSFFELILFKGPIRFFWQISLLNTILTNQRNLCSF